MKNNRSHTLLYGTGNPAKLNAMKRCLEKIGIEIIGLKDLNCPIPDLTEDGKTPLENARKKARGYWDAFHIPVFSCDSGLYFENVPDDIQPGVNVRRVNGKVLTDEEMTEYYASLAKKYGTLTARYRNAVCFVQDAEHTYESMDMSIAGNKFYITDKPHPRYVPGFPLDRLSVDISTGRYYYDLSQNETDALAVDDGFIDFFGRIYADN